MTETTTAQQFLNAGWTGHGKYALWIGPETLPELLPGQCDAMRMSMVVRRDDGEWELRIDAGSTVVGNTRESVAEELDENADWFGYLSRDAVKGLIAFLIQLDRNWPTAEERCKVCPDCLKRSCDMECHKAHGCMDTSAAARVPMIGPYSGA